MDLAAKLWATSAMFSVAVVFMGLFLPHNWQDATYGLFLFSLFLFFATTINLIWAQ